RRPQLFSVVAVPRPDLIVTPGAEHETRLGDDDAVAHLRNARSCDSPLDGGGILAEANAPLDGRLVQVVFHDRREGRLHAVADRAVFVDHQALRLRHTRRIRRESTPPPRARW